MPYRIPPPWWPVLAVASPVIAPFLAVKNLRFKKNNASVEKAKQERLDSAGPLDLPELDSLELTVLAEWEKEEGFKGEPGVSYLLRTNLGSLLYDVSFGPGHDTLAHNAAKLGVTFDQIDAVVISHLHPDHMGGMKASRAGEIRIPDELGSPEGKTCFLPDKAGAPGLKAQIVKGPELLPAGIATTGPLPRSLFFLGWTEEQALVARLKGKGLVVITGCGHPTIELILQMVGRLSSEPIHAIVGGLHFPVTRGRGAYGGIQMQMLFGTGKPPWDPITDDDLSAAISAIKDVAPRRVCLSAHDSCDHALARMKAEINADTEILKAGARYTF